MKNTEHVKAQIRVTSVELLPWTAWEEGWKVKTGWQDHMVRAALRSKFALYSSGNGEMKGKKNLMC